MSESRTSSPGAPAAVPGEPHGSSSAGDDPGVNASRASTTASQPESPSFSGEHELPIEPLGRYVLQEELARGGQGIVYLAYDAHLGRQIAFKILRPALADREPGLLSPAEARFLREARVTAQLDHPGIAPVHEVGRQPSGALYVTQKLLRGRTLAAALAACHNLEERLGLLQAFVAICQAVAYAHERGVIHRDLKPSNAMLGELGEAVVVDWGLARTAAVEEPTDAMRPPLDSLLEADSGGTREGAVIGTPAYMSPEQAAGANAQVDARSDVWSLGVMLYELLAGRRPHQGATAAEVLAAVRGGPPAPIASVVPEVPPELATIVGRAMAADPRARYATAGELAEELKLFLNGRLVRSHSYSTWELVRRWARRHALPLALSGAFALLLAAGGVLSVRRILSEKERANREAAVSRGVSDFMSRIFQTAKPSVAKGANVTAREVVDKAAQDLESNSTLDPEIRARLMLVLGSVHHQLGLYPQSLALLEKARRLFDQHLGPDHPDSIRTAYESVIPLRMQNKTTETESLLRDVVPRARRVLGPAHETTLGALNQLGMLLHGLTREAEAEQVLVEALETARRAHGRESLVALRLMNNLSLVYKRQNRLAEAEKLLIELRDVRVRVSGPDHPQTIAVMVNLADVYSLMGRVEHALTLLEKALSVERRVLGSGHPEVLLTVGSVVDALLRLQRYAEAEPLAREEFVGRRASLGSEDPSTVSAMTDLGISFAGLERRAEAEKLLAEALASRNGLRGTGRPVAESVVGMALLAARLGRKDTAMELLKDIRDGGMPTVEWRWTLDHPLLAPLQGDPRFEALAAEARKTAQ